MTGSTWSTHAPRMCARNFASETTRSQVRADLSLEPAGAKLRADGTHPSVASRRRYTRAMRGGVLAAAILASALAAVPLAGATSRRSSATPQMTVTASPDAASAHGPRLVLSLRYQMQCGYPGVGPLVVRFPRAVRLPRRFTAGAVRLSGKPIATTRAGRQVTVTIAPPGQLCGLIGPGSLKLVFTRKAKLVNPRRAGSYLITATHANHTFRATLVIKSAA